MENEEIDINDYYVFESCTDEGILKLIPKSAKIHSVRPGSQNWSSIRYTLENGRNDRTAVTGSGEEVKEILGLNKKEEESEWEPKKKELMEIINEIHGLIQEMREKTKL